MAKTFTVKARFLAEDRASGTIAKVEGRFKRLTSTIKSSALAQVAALGGVAVALRGLTKFISSSIEKANEQENAVNQLNAALSTLGPTAAGVSQRLQEQASALQKVTTFGDETIIKVQTMIASFVKNEDSIKAATAATLDFSKAFGIELNAAAALVSKSLGSSTNALTRYGIEVTGAVGSTERLTSLIENVATVAGGRAAAAVNTFSGAWDQLVNALGDVQEDLAGVATKNEEIISGIQRITKAIQEADVASKVGETATSISDLGTGVKAVIQPIQDLVDVIQEIGSRSGTVGDIVGGVVDKITRLHSFIRESASLNFKPFYLDYLIDLGKKSREAVEEQEKLDEAYRKTAQRQAEAIGVGANYIQTTEEAAEAVKRLADEEKRLKKELEGAEEAMAAFAASIGVVTSAQLEQEILKIETGLAATRKTTFGLTEEFRTLEATASEKVDSLKARILSLKDGMGDLSDEVTGKTAPAFDTYTKSLEGTNSELERQRGLTQGLTGDQKKLNEEVARAPASDRLVASQGGTRFRPSRSLELRGLSPFGTGGGPARVDSNGSINT